MPTHMHTHLDACACLHFAQTADERPAAGWDVGDFGDGFHPLRTSNAHLRGRDVQHGDRLGQEVKSKAERTSDCLPLVSTGHSLHVPTWSLLAWPSWHRPSWDTGGTAGQCRAHTSYTASFQQALSLCHSRPRGRAAGKTNQ